MRVPKPQAMRKIEDAFNKAQVALTKEGNLYISETVFTEKEIQELKEYLGQVINVNTEQNKKSSP